MSNGMMLTIGEDGTASVYDDTYDITIHCESQEERDEAERRLMGMSWIPCSERLPDENDAGILKKLGTSKRSKYVLATVEVKGERMTVTAWTHDGKWNWKMKYAFPDYKIIAWMPLPEPCREGEKQ